METYIERFIVEAKNQGYSDAYIELCTRYASRLIDNGLPVIFEPDHLAEMIGLEPIYLRKLFYLCDQSKRLYKQVNIPKKSGGIRVLCIPTEGLKYVQKWILDNILYNFPVSEASNGFVKKKSIVSNAIKHVNKQYVLNYDIQDFFPNIKRKDVFRIFKYYGYTNEVSYLLSKLCTFKNALPQGAPTSPYLSNIHCLRLDKRLTILSEKIGADYTRYADDITISGDQNVTDYTRVIKKIINSEGFNINPKKTRHQKQIGRQMVTGLIVNKKVTVPIQRKRYLRQQIYYCKKFGVSNHLSHININKSNYKQYLYGLAFFVKMVEKEKGELFLRELDEILWDY